MGYFRGRQGLSTFRVIPFSLLKLLIEEHASLSFETWPLLVSIFVLLKNIIFLLDNLALTGHIRHLSFKEPTILRGHLRILKLLAEHLLI